MIEPPAVFRRFRLSGGSHPIRREDASKSFTDSGPVAAMRRTSALATFENAFLSGEPAPGSRGRMYIRAFCTRVRWRLTGAGGRHGSGTASLGRAGGRLRGSREMTARDRRACAREAPAVLRSGPHGGPRRRTPGSRHAPWRVVRFFRRGLQSRLDDDDDFPSNRRPVPAVPDWGINRRGTPCQSKRG